jgi:energy-coupling factor transporter ATP-binding protein EcfA2
MRIAKLHVANYRSILDETLDCEQLTILIGRNGAGKSAFLQALRLFMDTSASPSGEDFYDHDATRVIQIEVTFSDLDAEEQAEFRSYLDNGVLVVQRRFPSGDYYGRVTGCEELEPIRDRLRRKAKAGDVAPELQALVDTGSFPGLRAVSREIVDELDRWERENPARCRSFFRAGIFQGPTNIAGGKMRNRTHFVYVAPVREAESDATGGGKQSPLAVLVGPLLSAITERNVTVKAAQAAIQTGYEAYKCAVEGAPEKETLESRLTAVLRRYDAQTAAEVQLSLDEKLALPTAKPRVWLVEDGFHGEVARKGHGLQRLFIFAILELYEKFRGGTPDESPPSLVLVIEEPELYQHPARSRALARTLIGLCNPEVAGEVKFQVLFSTHSPYFVSLDSFQSIRRVEKTSAISGPMQTRVKRATLAEVGNVVLAALGQAAEASDASTWARLKTTLGLRGSEGLFADGVILVEGAQDEAVLDAYAEHVRMSLDSAGIAIVPAEGKTKLPHLHALYSTLGIPTYVIFDADGNKNEGDAHMDYNRALLVLIEETPEDRPTTRVAKSGAVWTNEMIEEVRAAFGTAEWDGAFAEARAEFSMDADTAKKNYAVTRRAAQTLLSEGRPCSLLDTLWDAIVERFTLGIPGTGA